MCRSPLEMHTAVKSHARDDYTHYQFNSHRCHHRMHKLCGLYFIAALCTHTHTHIYPAKVCRMHADFIKISFSLSLFHSFHICKYAQVPLFNGSSYLRFAALGDTALIWLELKVSFHLLLFFHTPFLSHLRQYYSTFMRMVRMVLHELLVLFQC